MEMNKYTVEHKLYELGDFAPLTLDRAVHEIRTAVDHLLDAVQEIIDEDDANSTANAVDSLRPLE